MYEILVGVAIGYIAFTENGHKIGNSIADYAVKVVKPEISKVFHSGAQKVKTDYESE